MKAAAAAVLLLLLLCCEVSARLQWKEDKNSMPSRKDMSCISSATEIENMLFKRICPMVNLTEKQYSSDEGDIHRQHEHSTTQHHIKEAPLGASLDQQCNICRPPLNQ
jgi:hypothetical protein